MRSSILRVHFDCGYGDRCTLKDINFEVQSSERLGLVGTSGAGKSTLALALMGLLPWRRGWARGEVLFDGKDLLSMKEHDARRIRGRRIALVPQSPMASLNSAISLRAHFEESWRAHTSNSSAALAARLKQLMEQVQLPAEYKFLLRRPGEVSVGQAQRAAIALALLHRPALLIADEPTSALDPVTQIEILSLLRQANEEDGTALLYISHDLLSVLKLCDRIAVLDEGQLVECLNVASIEEDACHPATLSLLSTLPAPASVLRSYNASIQPNNRATKHPESERESCESGV